MKSGILGLILSPVFILSTIVLITIIIAIKIIHIETKLKEKAGSIKEPRTKYLEELKNLKTSQIESKQKLDKLNSIYKNMIKERYDLSTRLNYYDLMEKLKDLYKDKTSNFSEKMAKAYYAEQKISNAEIDSLINELIKIIESQDWNNETLEERENKHKVNEMINSIKKRLDVDEYNYEKIKGTHNEKAGKILNSIKHDEKKNGDTADNCGPRTFID